MTDQAFDYRRYAPLVPPRLRPPAHQRPQLAWSHPGLIAPPHPDELTQQLGRIRNSLVLIRQSSAEASVILWRRFLDWCDAHILRSLTSAWVIAGIGWGGCIVFPAVLYFTR